MLRNKLVRSDGSIIDSSVIISCEYTEGVNSSTNLTVGDVTSSELSVEILSKGSIQQDEILTYSIIEDGVERPIGVFKAEKPTVATRSSIQFTAYDNIAKTEKSFSEWLRDNQTLFPMTLLTLVQHACSHCGVTLATTDFPHADLQVTAFSADGITCRQILSWAAAIAGRFVRANVAGKLEFAWYGTESSISIVSKDRESATALTLIDDGEGNVTIQSDDLTLTDDGEGNVSIASSKIMVANDGAGGVYLVAEARAIPFLQGSLTYESYNTDLINRVQIKHSEDDVGVIYPASATGNCFTIAGNLILGAANNADVTSVAQSLYEQLKNTSYVPFGVTIPRTISVRAGDMVSVADSNGKVFTSYAMKVAVSPRGTEITATGDKSYGSNAAVAYEKYENLTGKVMTISKTVDGLTMRNADLEGKVGGLELSTEEFKTYVQNTYVSGDDFTSYKTTVSSEFKETAEGFTMTFENVKKNISDINGELESVSKEMKGLDKSLVDVKAYINPGIVDYDDDNIPIYGLEVGQRTNVNGQEVFYKYARFTSNRLSFFDQSDNEVAYISDQKLYITHAEITESSKHGGFIDTVLEDGSILSKWVGGVS